MQRRDALSLDNALSRKAGRSQQRIPAVKKLLSHGDCRTISFI